MRQRNVMRKIVQGRHHSQQSPHSHTRGVIVNSGGAAGAEIQSSDKKRVTRKSVGGQSEVSPH